MARRAARRRRRLPGQPPGRRDHGAVRLLRRHRRARLGATATTCGRHDRGLEPDQLDPGRRALLGVLARSAAAAWARPAAATRTGSRPRPCRASATRPPGCSPRNRSPEAILAGDPRRPHDGVAHPAEPGRRAVAARGGRATATAASSRSSATRCRPGRRCGCARPGAPAAGLVKVRANGATIVDEVPLGPDGELRFRAPDERGWVRADLMLAPGATQGAPGCEPNGGAITHLRLRLPDGRRSRSPIYLSALASRAVADARASPLRDRRPRRHADAQPAGAA